MNNPQILPECYADTLLVEMLGFEPNHKSGIGEVINTLTESFKNRPAVGIIDNDKRKPNDFVNFALDKEDTGIQRRRKADTKHTLLVITPAFEDWVFENANAVGIDPANYGFRTRKSFRVACKTENASANPKLKQFLNTLKQKKSPGFKQLKTWICEGAGIDEKDLL
jgi:hypothetical protein